MAEPAVQAWRSEHQMALNQAAAAVDFSASPYQLLSTLVHALFAAEGGTATVNVLAEECAAAYVRERDRQPTPHQILHDLPDGTRLRLAASEHLMRSPLVTLCYPAPDGTCFLRVLRDARLGALAGLADTMAERYLVPASEIVAFILTGAGPQILPVRLGLRYRRFQVHGVPVTASSRIALEVDPQIEAADLARTFAQWQHANKVTPCHADPALAALAGKLIGRLWPRTARRTGPRPPDNLDPTLTTPSATYRQAWATIANDTNTDRRLINRKTTAIVRILNPLDNPHTPRWLPTPTSTRPDTPAT